MEKARIVEELGEAALLLPQEVNEALAANARVKYRFTLLQTARQRADHPGDDAPSLRRERLASRVEEPELDQVVERSHRNADGSYLVPGASELHARIVAEIRAMIRPLEHAAPGARPDTEPDGFALRLETLLERTARPSRDCISAGYVSAVTQAHRPEDDSLHLLVMDLHRELNRLQAAIAEDSIDGASVYMLRDDDESRVRAFMSGLNATAPLKFDHPGLGTTATHSGGRLVIENDIGTTGAHVLVVHVDGLETVITYTDVHVQRAHFFRSLFLPYGVKWEDTRSRHAAQVDEGDTYYLCVGSFVARDQDELDRYLRFLGSRLVFLIDWNKARKRLRQFLPKADVLELLRWAAEEEIGHRGFLVLGGERLIYEAMDFAATEPVRYGERLDQILGRPPARDYLRYVLRTASAGLRGGRSPKLISDEIKTELLNYFQTAQQGLLDLALRHAAIVVDLANVTRDCLRSEAGAESAARLARAAAQAARWETRADDLVSRTREAVKRSSGSDAYPRILKRADDAVDGLEEAVFLLTLLPVENSSRQCFEPLHHLSGLVVAGAQEFVKAIESASHVQRGGAREDLQDFFEAVDRLISVEHESDDVHRKVTIAMVAELTAARELFLMAEIARHLEAAVDALRDSALWLKDHVLGEIILS